MKVNRSNIHICISLLTLTVKSETADSTTESVCFRFLPIYVMRRYVYFFCTAQAQTWSVTASKLESRQTICFETYHFIVFLGSTIFFFFFFVLLIYFSAGDGVAVVGRRVECCCVVPVKRIKHTLNSTISTLILPHTGDVFAHWRVNEWKIATIFLFPNARHAYKWVWRIAIFILLRSFGIQFERYAIFIVRFFPLALTRRTPPPTLHLPLCQSSRSHTQFVRLSCWQFSSTIACLFEYFMQIQREYPVCVWWQPRRRRRRRRQHHFLQMCVANGLFISFTFA